MTRDEQIIASCKSGLTYAEIGERFGLSQGRISQILIKNGVRRTIKGSKRRTQRVREVYLQLVQYKLEHDGNTFPKRELARLHGNSADGIYTAIHTLVRLGLIERDSGLGDIIIIGGKWIPPEEPNWEELL